MLRPENTIEAFDHGLSFGADGLELDVHLSRDGVVVVHHDETLERTTSGSGPIAACTADELDAVDAGYRFTPDPDASSPLSVSRARHRRSSLARVLQRYPSARLIVELKMPDVELAHRTIDEIRAADALGRGIGFVLRACAPGGPCLRATASHRSRARGDALGAVSVARAGRSAG